MTCWPACARQALGLLSRSRRFSPGSPRAGSTTIPELSLSPDISVAELKSLYAWRRPGTHLAAFSSVDIRPGIPPSSALRCTHLDDANRKGT